MPSDILYSSLWILHNLKLKIKVTTVLSNTPVCTIHSSIVRLCILMHWRSCLTLIIFLSLPSFFSTQLVISWEIFSICVIIGCITYVCTDVYLNVNYLNLLSMCCLIVFVYTVVCTYGDNKLLLIWITTFSFSPILLLNLYFMPVTVANRQIKVLYKILKLYSAIKLQIFSICIQLYLHTI